MLKDVGETAGRVWHALEQKGPLLLPALQKQIEVTPTLLHMALGWLAREDKIEIARDGRSYRVQLK